MERNRTADTRPFQALGRPRRYEKRRVLDAIFYLVRIGTAWRMMPKGLPPWRICYHYFSKWKKDGVWGKVHGELRGYVRCRSGKKKAPSAAAIGSQSVRTARNGGIRGYDAGKGIKGRKRRVLVDRPGLVLVCVAHSASVRDRDGAKEVLSLLEGSFGWIARIWADGGYAGTPVEWVSNLGRRRRISLEIVKRSDDAKGFEVLPRRWIVERTFAWLENSRRLSRDYEATVESSKAMIHIAMIRLMAKRLAYVSTY